MFRIDYPCLSNDFSKLCLFPIDGFDLDSKQFLFILFVRLFVQLLVRLFNVIYGHIFNIILSTEGRK